MQAQVRYTHVRQGEAAREPAVVRVAIVSIAPARYREKLRVNLLNIW